MYLSCIASMGVGDPTRSQASLHPSRVSGGGECGRLILFGGGDRFDPHPRAFRFSACHPHLLSAYHLPDLLMRFHSPVALTVDPRISRLKKVWIVRTGRQNGRFGDEVSSILILPTSLPLAERDLA